MSLKTVQVLSEVGLSAHTLGCESRVTLTTGLTEARTVTGVLLVSPQSVTPGVVVLVPRVRMKLDSPGAVQPAGGWVH
jgi:predicted alpha/beta hydrolase family esterase